jgi:hypothetical protein
MDIAGSCAAKSYSCNVKCEVDPLIKDGHRLGHTIGRNKKGSLGGGMSPTGQCVDLAKWLSIGPTRDGSHPMSPTYKGE